MGIDELALKLGGLGRARLVWDCYSIGVDPQLHYSDSPDPDIQKLLPSCRRTQRLGKEALKKLSSLYKDRGIEGGVASLSHISTSADSTTKLLLKLADGLEVETVIIPWNDKRSTLCISSQVGCRQGCRFCATGKMSLLRSLSSDEILCQMFFGRKICRLNGLPEISGVVFMGMGEPGDNLDAVIRATEILTTRELFQLSARKVTVSSVSPTPDTFRLLGQAPCVLAWSVHAANDKLRKHLVPTTKYPMVELRQGMMDALLDRPLNVRTTMWEVALIAGVNDSMEAADELIDFARAFVEGVPGAKLIVNLIPFNDIGHPVFRKPSHEGVVAFQQRLWTQGICAHIRTTRGDDESAACGQLATNRRKEANTKSP
jgi:23S rRNA (adenine2503-C2)-methyltransferase